MGRLIEREIEIEGVGAGSEIWKTFCFSMKLAKRKMGGNQFSSINQISFDWMRENCGRSSWRHQQIKLMKLIFFVGLACRFRHIQQINQSTNKFMALNEFVIVDLVSFVDIIPVKLIDEINLEWNERLMNQSSSSREEQNNNQWISWN